MSENTNHHSIDLQEYLDLIGYEKASVEAAQAPTAPIAATCQVLGEGDPHAELMFIGELQEGPAGELLHKMIQAMGYQRNQVYIAAVSRGGPSDDRDPSPEEVSASSPILLKQVELIQPKAIVTLGLFTAQVILESNISLSEMRAKPWPKTHAGQEFTVFPTFHPGFLLRNTERKKDVWEDLKRVMAFLSD